MREKVKEYRVNPSIQKVKKDLVQVEKTVKKIKSRDGIFKGKYKVITNKDVTSISVDKTPFVRAYYIGLVKTMSLSKQATKLLCYILAERIEQGKTSFFYFREIANKVTGIQLNNLTIALRELIDNEFIYKSNVRNEYWLNIEYFSKGNRAKICEEFNETVLDIQS